MRHRIAAAATRCFRARHGAAAYAAALCLLGCGISLAQVVAPEPLASVVRMIDAGQFKAADAAIDGALTQATDPAEKSALQFQRERMRRILLDFDQSADQVKAQIKKQIPDLKDDEFARWDARGYIEHRVIDGRTLYFNRAASNLFRLSAEARARRAHPQPFDDSPLQTVGAYHAKVIQAALQAHRASVLPQRLRITQSLTVKPDAVPAGETIKAWIPYPRAILGQQEDIRFVSSEPAAHEIAPETALQRTVFLQQPAVAGKPTRFSITYEVTISARYQPVDPEKVIAAKITPELEPYVSERPPHIVFTEQLRLFSKQIVGDEKNPWRIAQKLYAAVDAIPWAGAREYSTITDISDAALRQGHADCGQQTLLLMTLLRMNGIPTRWQSGMIFSGGKYWDLHDWGWLYLAPYGWLPMDVTFGRLDSADPKVAGFYLGGLDGYRVAFNDDYGRELTPAKQYFRSDTVDNQRGEAEWRGGNLYYDQWDYDFTWQILPNAQH
jgi:transglutaminase-like putative cysteine protease